VWLGVELWLGLQRICNYSCETTAPTRVAIPRVLAAGLAAAVVDERRYTSKAEQITPKQGNLPNYYLHLAEAEIAAAIEPVFP